MGPNKPVQNEKMASAFLPGSFGSASFTDPANLARSIRPFSALENVLLGPQLDKRGGYPARLFRRIYSAPFVSQMPIEPADKGISIVISMEELRRGIRPA